VQKKQPVSKETKRVLKEAKKPKQYQTNSYEDTIKEIIKSPQKQFIVSDFLASPEAVKKGLDRVIKKNNYSIMTSVQRTKVIVRKNEV